MKLQARLSSITISLVAAILAVCAATAIAGAKETDAALDISGAWRFQLDAAKIGVNERWFIRSLSEFITARSTGSKVLHIAEFEPVLEKTHVNHTDRSSLRNKRTMIQKFNSNPL